MIIRNDLLPHSYTIPKSHQDALLRIGGKNPFGEPMYRIILMETRVTKASGDWNIWDDSVDIDDRGGVNFKKALELARAGASSEQIEEALTPATPLRVDHGIADIPLYPSEGFCIEKWKPASTFGPPSDWPADQGPYPQYGDYELLAGPVPHLPSITDMETAVRENMRNVDNRVTSKTQRYLNLLTRWDLQNEARKKRLKEIAEDSVKYGPASLYNTLSLGAGRVMNDLALKAGLKGHYGA